MNGCFILPGFLFVWSLFFWLTGLTWNFNSAQICISQMTSAKGCFIKHFWAIFSLSLCLSSFSDPFWMLYIFSWLCIMSSSCFVNIYHLSVVMLAKISTPTVYHLFTQLFLYLCKCFSVFWSPMIQLLRLFTANIFPNTASIPVLAFLIGDMDEDLAYRIALLPPELWSLDRFLQQLKSWHFPLLIMVMPWGSKN